jgi:hypothetical protein
MDDLTRYARVKEYGVEVADSEIVVTEEKQWH